MKTHHFSTALSTSLGKPNRFPSPAKLNLFLYINGKLPNGYHELQTLFQFLDFGDWLTIDIRQDINPACAGEDSYGKSETIMIPPKGTGPLLKQRL